MLSHNYLVTIFVKSITSPIKFNPTRFKIRILNKQNRKIIITLLAHSKFLQKVVISPDHGPLVECYDGHLTYF